MYLFYGFVHIWFFYNYVEYVDKHMIDLNI